MPRTEQSLDPLDGPLASFAYDLRVLREKAGHVPYRALARRAGFSASTLSVAASGRVLPSLDVTLAYVQACGGDPEPWRERWQTLVGVSVRDNAADTSSCREGPGAPSLALECTAWQLPDDSAAIAARNPAGSAGRGTRHLYAMLATAAVTLIAFVLARGAIGAQVTSAAAGPAGIAINQLGDLYRVISQGVAVHDDTNALVALRARADWPRERNFLLTAATVRFEQAEQVSVVDVSQVPDGTQMAESLHEAWADRHMADMFYAVFASSPVEHASAPGTVDAFDQAQAFDNAAQMSENQAVTLWNTHASALGEPQISERAF